jgi:hypothetical protein
MSLISSFFLFVYFVNSCLYINRERVESRRCPLQDQRVGNIDMTSQFQIGE